jgi:anti-sigma regulatory factor (Ser/Thr protein kinase)
MRLWLDALIETNSINRKTAFSMRIALEEALSNIILHGYISQPGHNITIHFQLTAPTEYAFFIEDTAPHFSPLNSEETSDSPSELQSFTHGGHGLNLLRKFTTSLAYESLPTGNRLTLTFAEN